MRTRWIVVGVMAAMLAAGCGSENGTGSKDKGPDGQLYVLNQGDATMYVYDTKTLARIDSIGTVVDQPHYIEFSPDGQSFYIVTLETTGGHIAKFNANSRGFVSSVAVPAIPSAIAITSDSRYGYICDFAAPGAATRVRKYDLTTLQEVNSMQAGQVTHDLKITSDGAIVIATNRATDNLTMIYTDEDTVTFIPMTENDPNPTSADYGPLGAVIDHKDSLAFIACIDSDEIRVLDIAARTIVDSINIPVTVAGGSAGPTLLAVSPDDDVVFVTTQFNNTVVAVRVSTKEILAQIPLSANGPFGISMSDDGTRVYVACINIGQPDAYFYVINGNTYTKVDSVKVGNLNYGLIWQPGDLPMPD